MRNGDGGHGEDGNEIGDAPPDRDKGSDGHNDHANDEDDGEEHGEFELLSEVYFVSTMSYQTETEAGVLECRRW